MKKIKLPKVKFRKFNLKSFLNYILTIIISAVILALVLISLPLTEKVTSSASYDLVNKNKLYWAKEYILELNTENSKNIQDDIQETRSVLQRRLRSLGIEQSQIVSYKEDDKEYLKVQIQSAKDIELVENLIKTPYILNIVTKKDDVNYEDEENPLTPYLEENYNKTSFTRDSFRNVYITKLKNSSGEYSYFGLFKTWPWQKDWNNFLLEYSGQTVGVSIDGFVTPVQILPDDKTFAPAVSATEEKYVELIDILYNSGTVNLPYSVVAEEDAVVDMPEINYIKLTEGILVAILFIYLYLLLIEKTSKETLFISGISSCITVTGWIAYLKISSTPVDIFILALEVITIVVVIRIIAENIESRINVTLLITFLSILSMLLGSGYVKMFSNDLLLLIILSNISLLISSYYVSNVRKSLKL